MTASEYAQLLVERICRDSIRLSNTAPEILAMGVLHSSPMAGAGEAESQVVFDEIFRAVIARQVAHSQKAKFIA